MDIESFSDLEHSLGELRESMEIKNKIRETTDEGANEENSCDEANSGDTSANDSHQSNCSNDKNKDVFKENEDSDADAYSNVADSDDGNLRKGLQGESVEGIFQNHL
jgi:hypothetical protein